MEASYLVGSFPCQFDQQSVFDIPVWDGVWDRQPLDISALSGRLLTANIHCPHFKYWWEPWNQGFAYVHCPHTK